MADVIVWYDEQLRSMVHNSPFVNNVANVIVGVQVNVEMMYFKCWQALGILIISNTNEYIYIYIHIDILFS